MPVNTVKIHCANCSTLLYKYYKGGSGSLIKCWLHKIVKDYTKGDMTCPKCNQQFSRYALIRNRPAHKIIQGKVVVKGHSKK